MKNKNIFLIVSFTLGTILSPLACVAANEKNATSSTLQEGKTVTITVNVNYLGSALDGVSASIVKDGKAIAESTTDTRGKALIKVENYTVGAVDLQLKKEGYQTQILSGLILKNGSEYNFSLTKGTGVVTTAVSTGINKIEEKSTEEIAKLEAKEAKAKEAAEASKLEAEKAAAKAGEYTEAAKAEAEKAKELERSEEHTSE